MDMNLFVNIASRAWAMPILWSLHDGVAGRQAPLLAATGASRTAFSQSIEHLIEIGLLERNPGYGHPLRPEFRLTGVGKMAAAVAYQIKNVSSAEDQLFLRRSWTLPVLAVLYVPRHFNDIKRSLRPITDRALSHSLRSMEERDWIHRGVIETSRPPRPLYTATNTGEKISAITAKRISFPSC